MNFVSSIIAVKFNLIYLFYYICMEVFLTCASRKSTNTSYILNDQRGKLFLFTTAKATLDSIITNIKFENGSVKFSHVRIFSKYRFHSFSQSEDQENLSEKGEMSCRYRNRSYDIYLCSQFRMNFFPFLSHYYWLFERAYLILLRLAQAGLLKLKWIYKL